MTISTYVIPGVVNTEPYDAKLIVGLVTEYFKIRERSIYSNSRQAVFCIPRQIAMHLIKKKTNMSSVHIGLMFNRDHSTVLHSLSVIRDYYFTKNEPIINAITEIEEKLRIHY